MTINVTQAIFEINSKAEYVIREDDINNITWKNGTTPISKADIEAKMAELQADYDAKQYQRDRAKEYPTLQEFAEAYCEKEIGNTSTKWDAYVIKYNQVRTENPKD
jgi:hypothetical protein